MEKTNENSNAEGACEKQKCLEMLQVVLDGQADEKLKAEFDEHLKNCMPCFKSYNVDFAIKELLKQKCCGQHVPQDLKEAIKSKIDNLAV